MQVSLPSGATVDLRDKLKAGDKFAVQNAARVSLDTATGLQETPVGIVNVMRNALLSHIITNWSVTGEGGAQLPIPANNPDGGVVLGELDIDDYNALSDAVEPMLNKVMNVPNRTRPSGS